MRHAITASSLRPALAAALFILAVRLLAREIKSITWEEFSAGMTSVPVVYLGFAAFLIALNYGLLISYDLLALRYVAHLLPCVVVAIAELLAAFFLLLPLTRRFGAGLSFLILGGAVAFHLMPGVLGREVPLSLAQGAETDGGQLFAHAVPAAG